MTCQKVLFVVIVAFGVVDVLRMMSWDVAIAGSEDGSTEWMNATVMATKYKASAMWTFMSAWFCFPKDWRPD